MRTMWTRLVATLVVAGCQTNDAEPDDGAADGGSTGELSEEDCAARGDEWAWFDDQCVEWAYRYEPEAQLDADNVANPSNSELTMLADLRPPPKSGFRLVLTAVELGPFEEYEYCHSWTVPELTHEYVYTAEVNASPGLHHANVFGISTDADKGAQPTPQCHPGAASFIGGGIGDVIGGTPIADVPIPEILFANSTQIEQGEKNVLTDGSAFTINSPEIVADVHLYNPTPDPIRVEVVYDFYTMPAERVEQELKAFMYMFTDFKLPAQSKSDLVAECPWFGGDVHAIMPHMHEWGVGYDVKFFDDERTMVANPYSEAGFNLPESDIRVFDEPVDTRQASMVQFTCSYDNNLDHPMCHGIGENEMCFLFGYVSAEAQGFGIVPTDGAPCIGSHRESTEPFDLAEYLGSLEPDVRDRLIEVFTGPGGPSTCPDESPAAEPKSPW